MEDDLLHDGGVEGDGHPGAAVETGGGGTFPVYYLR